MTIFEKLVWVSAMACGVLACGSKSPERAVEPASATPAASPVTQTSEAIVDAQAPTATDGPPGVVVQTPEPLGSVNPTQVSAKWVVIDDNGTRYEYEFSGWMPPGVMHCSECGGPPAPVGMPVHTSVPFPDREIFRLSGARPAYRATTACPDRSPCWEERPLPEGRYRLVAEGNLVSCPETSFTIPVDRSIVITCVR